jgi:Arc/MetJ-type ribon-helix-helix transcriptional regulator
MTQLTVDLPTDLRKELEERIRHTEFDSLEEYVRFVLRTIVEEEDQADHKVDRDDQDHVEERLKDLGYV